MIRAASEADARAIARIHVASWQTTYRGIVPDAYLASLDAGTRTDRWQRILTEPGSQSIVLVAEDEQGQMAGFASGGPAREQIEGYDGELYAVYLDADRKRQGIGQRLVIALGQELLQRGYKSMLIWALRDNQPARRFYEALGGVYVTDQDIEIGGATLKEVAYGWPEIQSLITIGRGD